MKKTVFALMIALAASGYCGVVTNGIAPVRHGSIKGSNMVYTASQILSLLDRQCSMSTNGIAPGQAEFQLNLVQGGDSVNVYTKSGVDDAISKHVSVQTNWYPVFEIPLNSEIADVTVTTNSEGQVTDVSLDVRKTNYVGFELKASTNNFYNFSCNQADMTAYYCFSDGEAIVTNSVMSVERIPEPSNMVYWCDSEGIADTSGEGPYSMRKYVCDTKIDVDNRSWTFYKTSADLAELPNTVVVILDPAGFKTDSEWCHDRNRDIVWSYVRKGATAAEYGANSRYQWTPISPVRWLRQLPAWAYENGEARVLTKEMFDREQ